MGGRGGGGAIGLLNSTNSLLYILCFKDHIEKGLYGNIAGRGNHEFSPLLLFITLLLLQVTFTMLSLKVFY